MLLLVAHPVCRERRRRSPAPWMLHGRQPELDAFSAQRRAPLLPSSRFYLVSSVFSFQSLFFYYFSPLLLSTRVSFCPFCLLTVCFLLFEPALCPCLPSFSFISLLFSLRKFREVVVFRIFLLLDLVSQLPRCYIDEDFFPDHFVAFLFLLLLVRMPSAQFPFRPTSLSSFRPRGLAPVPHPTRQLCSVSTSCLFLFFFVSMRLRDPPFRIAPPWLLPLSCHVWFSVSLLGRPFLFCLFCCVAVLRFRVFSLSWRSFPPRVLPDLHLLHSGARFHASV